MRTLSEYLAIVSSQRHPVRFIFSRLLVWSRLCYLLKIKRPGYSLLFRPTALSLALWTDKDDRHNDSDILRALLQPGDLYVDVGANIGHLVIEAALLTGTQGLVIALEAHPTTSRYMRENIALNGLENVYSAQCAVGERFGWIGFSEKRSDDQNHIVKGKSGITVPMIPLDCILTGLSPVLLKIDVEGYEKNVLLGGREVLQRTEFIYFEAWDMHFKKFGYDFTDIYDFLSEIGFVIARVSGDGALSRVERNFSPVNCMNLLAFRSENELVRRTGWTIE